MTQRKLIIDADPGIGDALAILLALLDPDIDLLAVTAVAGCVSAKDATRNLHGILAQLDPPKLPRVGSAIESAGRDHPMSALDQLAKLNGPTGLGDCELLIAELHRSHESAKVLTDLVKQYPNSITLLTLGPLTNLAAAIERMPEFMQALGGLVCLGGAISVGGDATPMAEQNIFRDPEAARLVLRSPATKTLVPLDVTNRVELTIDQFERVLGDSNSAAATFLQRVMPFAFRAYHHCLGMEGILPRDVVALAAITRPDLFRSEPMAIDVETEGRLTWGTTVADRRRFSRAQPNIDVMIEVDSQGVLDYMREIVALSATT
ncbi:MAG: nucleoside hydrolase [Planctomycetota bacterium]